jgi:hypothetical protein
MRCRRGRSGRGHVANKKRDLGARPWRKNAAQGLASAWLGRRWPGRGRCRLGCRRCRRGRRRPGCGLGGGFGGAGGRFGRGRGGRFPLGRSLLTGGRRRSYGLQFDENRIGYQAGPSRFRLARRFAAVLGSGCHPHRHGLWPVTRERETDGELIARHRNGARGPAGLPERRPRFGTGRFGLELHGGCGWRRLGCSRLHPAWHA